MACRTCGCPGHGQCWQVRCVRCGRDKWPIARERPSNYVCHLCRLESPRQAAGRRGAARKAALAPARTQGAHSGPRDAA